MSKLIRWYCFWFQIYWQSDRDCVDWRFWMFFRAVCTCIGTEMSMAHKCIWYSLIWIIDRCCLKNQILMFYKKNLCTEHKSFWLNTINHLIFFKTFKFKWHEFLILAQFPFTFEKTNSICNANSKSSYGIYEKRLTFRKETLWRDMRLWFLGLFDIQFVVLTLITLLGIAQTAKIVDSKQNNGYTGICKCHQNRSNYSILFSQFFFQFHVENTRWSLSQDRLNCQMGEWFRAVGICIQSQNIVS